MSSIVIAGNSSGAITIDAPANAGSNTITLPVNSGTIITTGSTFAGTGPAFSAYLGSNQTVSQGTWTKLQINTEEFDTANCYDPTTNYRFTPNVAGYYFVNGTCSVTTTPQTFNQVAVYKNGSRFKEGTISSAAGAYFFCVSALIYLNGTTDYIELYGQTSGGTPTFQAGAALSYFQAYMARSA